jgi:hypothetical protein
VTNVPAACARGTNRRQQQQTVRSEEEQDSAEIARREFKGWTLAAIDC